jgi:hypothetical protein
MYLIARKILGTDKVKFGGFSGNPVIFRIPSGYARTGAYISNGNYSNSYYVGLCDFDTLGDRSNTQDSGGSDQNFFVAVYDTGEFIVAGTTISEMGLEILDPVTLNPVGFMVFSYSTITSPPKNSAIIATQNDVITTSTPFIIPEPIRVGNTIYVSRVYFLTPLGVVTTRHLYSGYTPNTNIGSAVQVGSKRFIRFGSWLVDVTGEV